MKTLKDCIKEDVKNVFFNINEFAETLTLQFPPDKPFEAVGILSEIEDTWKIARIPNDPKKEMVSLQIDSNADKFKGFTFIQGSEVKVNDIKYKIEKILGDSYTKIFLLGRSK